MPICNLTVDDIATAADNAAGSDKKVVDSTGLKDTVGPYIAFPSSVPSKYYITVAGDSLLDGTNPFSGAGNDVVSQAILDPKLLGRVTVVNTAQNGEGLAYLISTFDAQIKPFLPANNADIAETTAIVGIGTNDLNTMDAGGYTVESWLAAIGPYLAQYITNGVKRMIVCLVPRASDRAPYEGQRVAINAGLIKIAADNNYQILDRDTILAYETDRYMVPDGTHPYQMGNRVIAKALATLISGPDHAIEVRGYAEARRLDETIFATVAARGYMRIPQGSGNAFTTAFNGPSIGDGDFFCGAFFRFHAQPSDPNPICDLFGQVSGGDLRLIIRGDRRPWIYSGGQYVEIPYSPQLIVGKGYFAGYRRVSQKIYAIVNGVEYGPISNSGVWNGTRFFLTDSDSLLNNPPADVVAPVFVRGTTTRTQALNYFRSGGVLDPDLVASADIWVPNWNRGAVQFGAIGNDLIFTGDPVMVTLPENDTRAMDAHLGSVEQVAIISTKSHFGCDVTNSEAVGTGDFTAWFLANPGASYGSNLNFVITGPFGAASILFINGYPYIAAYGSGLSDSFGLRQRLNKWDLWIMKRASGVVSIKRSGVAGKYTQSISTNYTGLSSKLLGIGDMGDAYQGRVARVAMVKFATTDAEDQYLLESLGIIKPDWKANAVFAMDDPNTNSGRYVANIKSTGGYISLVTGVETVHPFISRSGVATLVAGTVTVNNPTVTATTRILYSVTETGVLNGELRLASRVVGTSFTISSSDLSDTASIAYQLTE